MTFSEVLRYVLRRKSFYLLMAGYAALFAVTSPLLDRNRGFLAVPIVISVVSYCYYLARVIGSARSGIDPDAKPDRGDPEAPE